MSMLSDAEIDDYEYRLRIGQTLLPQEIAALAAQAKSHAAVAEVVEPNNLVARLRFEGQGKYTNRPSYQKMDAQEQSAMYFLVWHCGMSCKDAQSAIKEDCSCINPLARAGQFEGRRCFDAINGWIDRVTCPPAPAHIVKRELL